jgi:4-hydroxy-3-methylbut-2-enyl diphosphate reductase
MSEYDVKMPTPGAIIKGKVVQISNDEVLVDIDYKSEGRIPLNELSFIANANPEDLVSVGEEINVKVLKVDDSEGNVVLSKKRADADLSWEKLENLYESGETLEAKVVQVVKGGLLVNVGVRGFIPASHVSRGFEDNLEKYIGQTLELKIIELDRSKNNVVFSHKVVLEEKHAKAKDEAFANLQEGMKVKGIVRRLTDFGAFVDIGDGVEGLLHVSEMAYSRVNHPSDVVAEGDEITVMVLGVDKERERISLGLKQTIPDPWSTVADRYEVGQKVTGEVTRVVDFGAFVKLEDGVEGLVHISELSHKHVAKAEDVVKSGDQVEAKVISVDPDARRIGLSIKELEPKPQVQPKPKQAQPNLTEGTSSEELTTNIGDMFGDLFKDGDR